MLEALRQAKQNNDGWVNGQYFLRTLMFSQYHARLTELKNDGYIIERGAKDEYGFYSYRLVGEPMQKTASVTLTADEARNISEQMRAGGVVKIPNQGSYAATLGKKIYDRPL